MAPQTPADWRDYLVRELDSRWSRIQVYDAYYEGDQTLAFITRKFRDAYGNLFRELTDNYMPLVVDAASERLRVNGFRFGPDQEADKDAWAIWQANNLDAESNMLQTEAIKLGCAYWLVQPNGDTPRITAEHPSQVIVAFAPGDRHVRLAALKKWADEEFIYANVYEPDRVTKYRTTRRQLVLENPAKKWETIGAVSNPLGEVPVVPIENNPSLLRGGHSDLAGGPISLQNGITKLLADMLIGSEYQAYPQRVLLGVDVPRDVNGKVIPNADLAAAQDRLWFIPGKDAQAFEFTAADLKNFREAMDGLIGDLAAQTRIPIYYFRPQAISNLSAEALTGLDAGLVSKSKDKEYPFGESHEEMMRLAFKSKDATDPRAEETQAEVIWRNTESRSQAQVVDAAVKLATIGVPQEVLWEKVGFSPQEIDRMRAIQETDVFLNAIQPSQPASNGAVPSALGGAGQPPGGGGSVPVAGYSGT